jgi:hypothetical protein
MPDQPVGRQGPWDDVAPHEGSGMPYTAAVAECAGALAWIEDTPQGPRLVVQGAGDVGDEVVRELVARLTELQQGMA